MIFGELMHTRWRCCSVLSNAQISASNSLSSRAQPSPRCLAMIRKAEGKKNHLGSTSWLGCRLWQSWSLKTRVHIDQP